MKKYLFDLDGVEKIDLHSHLEGFFDPYWINRNKITEIKHISNNDILKVYEIFNYIFLALLYDLNFSLNTDNIGHLNTSSTVEYEIAKS